MSRRAGPARPAARPARGPGGQGSSTRAAYASPFTVLPSPRPVSDSIWRPIKVPRVSEPDCAVPRCSNSSGLGLLTPRASPRASAASSEQPDGRTTRRAQRRAGTRLPRHDDPQQGVRAMHSPSPRSRGRAHARPVRQHRAGRLRAPCPHDDTNAHQTSVGTGSRHGPLLPTHRVVLRPPNSMPRARSGACALRPPENDDVAGRRQAPEHRVLLHAPSRVSSTASVDDCKCSLLHRYAARNGRRQAPENRVLSPPPLAQDTHPSISAPTPKISSLSVEPSCPVPVSSPIRHPVKSLRGSGPGAAAPLELAVGRRGGRKA